MRFREHVLDPLAGFDVPVRHLMLPHLALLLRSETLALAHRLHDLEGMLGLHAPVDEVQHDVVTGADRGSELAEALADKILGIVQPDIGPVGETRDTNELRESLWLCIPEHAHDETGAEFRDAERTKVHPVHILGAHPQRFRPRKE